MKRIAIAAILAALAAILALGANSYASQGAEVVFSVSSDPQELSEEGEVTLRLSASLANPSSSSRVELITATSDISGTNWTFLNPVLTHASPAREYTLEVFLSDEMISRKYEVTLIYRDSNGMTQAVSSFVTVNRAEPKLLFSRIVSASSAREGGVITITYEAINASNTTFTDIVIDDPNILSQPYTVDSLSPGQSRSFTYQHTLTQDVVTMPEITYDCMFLGEQKHIEATEGGVTLKKQVSQLDVRISSDKTSLLPGESATLWITVINEGTLPYTGVTLEGAYLPENINIGALNQGESFTCAYPLSPLASHSYTVTAKATSANGQPSEKTSEALVIAVEGSVVQDESIFVPSREITQSDLSMEARSVTTYSQDSEMVAVEVVVRNPSSVLSSVRLRERTLGIVDTLVMLSGDKRFLVEIPSESQTDIYEFTLEAVDQNGKAVLLYSACEPPAGADFRSSSVLPSNGLPEAYSALETFSARNAYISAPAAANPQIPDWLQRAIISALAFTCMCLVALSALSAGEFIKSRKAKKAAS